MVGLTMVATFAFAGCSGGDGDDDGGNGNGNDAGVQSQDSGSADTTSSDGGGGSDFEEVDCSSASPAQTVTLTSSNKFDPSSVTVSQGDVVKWDWQSDSHTVTSGGSCTPDGNFASGSAPENTGTTYCVKFNKTGSFDYHCVPHCAAGMTGSVTVQ